MYHVRLDEFEGPLDLLLFFIKRDEIDIYDIPIARIADEFLGYVRLMEQVDLDGVGDFIYMASLLLSIKAQMLLPSDQTEQEEEATDPRKELVERLLEYVRFKHASERLSERGRHRAKHFVRGEASSEKEEVEEEEEASPEVDASVYDLMRVLGDILIDAPDESEPTHQVEPPECTVEEQRAYVLEKIQAGREIAFRRLVEHRSKAFIIATFLAVLELARQRHLRLALGGTIEEFSVVAVRGGEHQAAETAAEKHSNGQAAT